MLTHIAHLLVQFMHTDPYQQRSGPARPGPDQQSMHMHTYMHMQHSRVMIYISSDVNNLYLYMCKFVTFSSELLYPSV